MIDVRFVHYRRRLPPRQRDLVDALTRKLLAVGPAAPLSFARETWWRWIQRALPGATAAQCKAMATYAMAAVASGIITLPSPGQPPTTASQLMSVASLASVLNALQNDLDSDNEVSQMSSMQLQMLMDARSKLLQTASDIEKSNSDTAMAIAGNIKQ